MMETELSGVRKAGLWVLAFIIPWWISMYIVGPTVLSLVIGFAGMYFVKPRIAHWYVGAFAGEKRCPACRQRVLRTESFCGSCGAILRHQ